MYIYDTLGLPYGERERNILIIPNESLISWTEGIWLGNWGEGSRTNIPREPPWPSRTPRWVTGWPDHVGIFLMCGAFPWRGLFACWCIVKRSGYFGSHMDMPTSTKELLTVNLVFIFLASCHLTFSSCTWNRTYPLWGLADTWMKRTLVMSWWLFISISLYFLTWISPIHFGGEIHILLSAREKSIN